jgi:F-type H+-transporting ATPase subunit gamma
MAGKTREIKGRMKAVGNIQRITNTMRMIATARFQSMQKRAVAAQAYTRKIAEVVGEVAANVDAELVSHPLLRSPAEATGRRLVLVITSNRGLCGAYNSNVLRKSMAKLAGFEAGTQVDLEVVGKKGLAFFRFNRKAVSRFHSEIGDAPGFAEVERVAERYIEAFTAGGYDSIDVAYMAFHSASRQGAEVLRLLPLEPPRAKVEEKTFAYTVRTEYDFSPEPGELLAELLPITVKTRLFQCFNEAVVSEQLARMVAMKAATDAAGKMSKNLARKFNRARQAAITTELSEIIGGAAALG